MRENQSTGKPRHIGRWIVALVAVLEIAVLVGMFFWVRSGACGIPTAQAFGSLFATGGTSGNLPTGNGGGSLPQQPAATGNQSGGGTTAGASGAGASVSGDLNQVPDPNCVAKTAAGLLNSDDATTPPSCAPMSPPPALRQAARQVQNLPQPEHT